MLPKFDLPADEAAEITIVEFRKEVNGDFLYTVEREGQQFSFFAPPEVHSALQQHGAKKGTRAVLSWKWRKVEGKARKIYTVSVQGAPTMSGAPVNGNGHHDAPAPPAPPDDTVSAAGAVMERCLRESLRCWQALGVPFDVGNVQATASTLFIQVYKA